MLTLLGTTFLLMLPAVPAQQRLASSIVRPYGDQESDSREVFSPAVRLPPNVRMPADYDDLVVAMLRRSPTFRAQCARIAQAPQLRIVVQRSIGAPPRAALTHLARQGDRLEADVEIGLLGDVVLLIAHEFEHIIEQLDGVNLVAMADRSGTGVRLDPTTGQFETERAVAIGQLVAREVSRAVARR